MVFMQEQKWQQVLQSRIQKVPIRGFGGSDQYLAFPSVNQSAYWLEGFAELEFSFQIKFICRCECKPRFYFISTKQEEMKPMICTWIWQKLY